MRFYLLDRITEIVPGEHAIGVKCWSLDNEIFRDHFPGEPATPGVLLTESMAQLGGILLEHSYYKEYSDKNNVYPILIIIQKAKFRTFVKPGDQCILECKVLSIDHGRGSVFVQTKVDGDLVCEATLQYIIGMNADMRPNPYVRIRDQYYHNILPEEFWNERLRNRS